MSDELRDVQRIGADVVALRGESFPTAELRFVERDGKRVLQQMRMFHNGSIITTTGGWVDVPLVEEGRG